MPSTVPGTHTITLTATDAIGQTTSATRTYTVAALPAVTITAPAPATVLALASTTAASYHCASAATIDSCTATVTRAGSPVSVELSNGSDLPASVADTYTLTATARDSVSQTSTLTRTYVVAAPPTATIASPADGARLATGAQVAASYACASAAATVVTCAARVTLPAGAPVGLASGSNVPSTQEGTHAITVTATDEVGQTTSVTKTYTVGGRPAVRFTSPAPGTVLALHSKSTMSYDCASAISRIVYCLALVPFGEPPEPYGFPSGTDLETGAAGTHTITLTARDALGQTSTLTRDYVVAAPPTGATTSPTSAQKVEQGDWIQAEYECRSAASTIATCTAKVEAPSGKITALVVGQNLPSTEEGKYTITRTGTDVLGQTQSALRTYTVRATPRLVVMYGVRDGNIYVGGRVTEACPTEDCPAKERAIAQLEIKKNATSYYIRATERVAKDGTFSMEWHHNLGSAPTAEVRVRIYTTPLDPTKKVVAAGRYRTLQITSPVSPRPLAQLDADDITEAPEPGEAGRVKAIYSGQLRTIRVNDVIAVGVGKATPYGLLARITKDHGLYHLPSGRGSEHFLDVVPASLTEALRQGQIDGKFADVQGYAAGSNDGLDTTKVTCPGGAVLSVGSKAHVRMGLDLTVGWQQPFKIDAEFAMAVKSQPQTSVAINRRETCKLDATEMLDKPKRLGRLEFQVGPVPIVVTTMLQATMSGEACAQDRASASALTIMDMNAGTKVEDGEYTRSGDLAHRSKFNPVKVSSNGTMIGRVVPEVEVLINGIPGPRFDFKQATRLISDVHTSPWWKLAVPLSVAAQLRLDVWKTAGLGSARKVVADALPRIDEADSPKAPAPAPDEEVINCE